MPLYPVFLDIGNKPCLVVGGGRVAERKVLSLLRSGAKVTVISPRLTVGLEKLARARKKGRKIQHIKRKYAPDDIHGFFIAISATDSEKTNQLVSNDAGKFNTPLNVVDNPKKCSFMVPAMIERGDLRVAVSTSGKSPFLARTLREVLDETLPAELETLTAIMGAVRNKLLKNNVKSAKSREIYNALVDAPLIEWISKGERARINGFLKENLGEGYTLSRLGIRFLK